VGLLLASALFIKRMVDLSQGSAVPHRSHQALAGLPDSVALYQIAGPLFFAAADKALSAMARHGGNVKHMVIDMHAVPSMDMSALVMFTKALEELERRGMEVYLVGVNGRVRQKLSRAGVGAAAGKRLFVPSAGRAGALIRQRLAEATPAEA
jgi:SulP family sulfate permease